jgi:small conductance mechanosensitive channel
MKALLQKFGVEANEAWSELLLPASRILLILILSWLAMRLSGKLISLFKKYITHKTRDAGSIKRAETLSQVFSNTAVVIILLITGMLILGELGISIAPILAAAGVVGVAVGFGAQSLIKDYFTGFFLLIEDQIRHGEFVEVAGKKGVVEEVTLRHVKLRDNDGSIHFIPNGIITTVTNQSRDYSHAVIDISVAYKENLSEVFAELQTIGTGMRSDPMWESIIAKDMQIVGVQELASSAVVIRCRFKVMPLEDVNVRREFLLRVKNTFEEQGIELPFPHLTLYAGETKQPGNTPAFRVQSQPMDIG